MIKDKDDQSSIDVDSLNCCACIFGMYCSGKHSLFLYTLTNFDAISHIAVISPCTNVLKIWQGSVISFAWKCVAYLQRVGIRNRGNPCAPFVVHAFTPRQPSSPPGLYYTRINNQRKQLLEKGSFYPCNAASVKGVYLNMMYRVAIRKLFEVYLYKCRLTRMFYGLGYI
jgi:hypothetical protein